MLIRPINESDNKSLSVILREVLIEMQIPKKGSAYEDPELDNMFFDLSITQVKILCSRGERRNIGWCRNKSTKRW